MCHAERHVRPYHHGDLRRQLLVQAGQVLEQEGPEGITLRGLARSLRVSHAAPGYHFSDRNALLIEVGRRGSRDARGRDGSEAGQRSGNTAPGCHRRGYLDFALANPDRFRLMFAGIADKGPSSSPTFAAAASRSFATLIQVTDSGGRVGPRPARVAVGVGARARPRHAVGRRGARSRLGTG